MHLAFSLHSKHSDQFVRSLWFAMSLLFVASFASIANGQGSRLGAELGTRPAAIEPAEAKALLGKPFGIATILIPLGNISVEEPPRIHVTEEHERVLYPSVGYESLPVRFDILKEDRRSGVGPLRDKLRKAIQSGRDALIPPQGLRISFLFDGEQPLQLRVRGDLDFDLTIRPENQSALHRPYLERWWKHYVADAKSKLARSDYPPLIETYLTSMLGERLGFPVPDLRDEAKRKRMEEPLSTLMLLGGSEDIRREGLMEAMHPHIKPKLVPLPPPPECVAPEVPELPPDLPLESIAKHVPPECFYLRFGKFSNYLWYDQVSSRRGGDLAQLAMMRGYNYETDLKIEKLLNAKMTTLTKLFGDSIVTDMAIIGRDLYVQEGPCLGVVLESTNNALLRTSLQQDRQATATAGQKAGVRLETIRILDHDVSFLHAPDHSVRSFVVEHDKYFFITTSQTLAKRFIEVAKGDRSLADSPHFQFARLLMPEKNNYTLFAYMSPEFFRALVSPQYQIELRRRLTALAHLEMAELASLAAKSEGRSANTIEELMDADLLPKWFHDRADGTRTLRHEGHWIDSLRGARGSFLPIADIEVLDASEEEVLRYQEQAQFYERDWKQTDPLLVGIRRFTSPDLPATERIALEAYVAPFGKEKYGWISAFLAPPVQSKIRLPPDDIANLQVHLSGNQIGRRFIPDHVLFLGLKDLLPPSSVETKGLIRTLRILKETPAYLGAWPLPGHLDYLPIGLGGGPPDALGFSKLLLGLWRWQGGGFSVISFDRSILENCIPHLGREPAEDPAQARLQVGNLGGSQLAKWINGYWYQRGVATSMGNAMLLDAMHQQLHVPQKEALDVAQRLLNCKLQCPLGGDYLCDEGGMGLWNSTKTPRSIKVDIGDVPEDYQAPWLQWFRGLEAHLTQLDDRLVLIGQCDVEPLPPDTRQRGIEATPLPTMNFDIFRLPFQMMNGEKSKDNPPKPPNSTRRKF